MKNMSNKKILIIGLIIIAVCLIVAGIMMFANRSTKRMPTEQETAACAPYAVDWQAVTGQEGSDRQIILSLCTYAEKQTIGSNEYDIYTSDTLGSYLYKFGEMTLVGVLNEEAVYIQYTDTDGNSITLTYSDEGLAEKAVYFPETDILFYEQGELTEVWEKFRTGVQFGA